ARDAPRPRPPDRPVRPRQPLKFLAAPQGIGELLAIGHEGERHGIDAKAQARRLRPAREDMALMAIATRAARFNAVHAVGSILHTADVGGIDGRGEAGPAGAAFKLCILPKQWQPAQAAAIDARLLLVE